MESIVKRSNSAYFVFGRFQPPTIGHGLLINNLEQTARTAYADAYIFVSSTRNKALSSIRTPGLECKNGYKNPLNINTKIATLKKMFPSNYVQFVDTTLHNCNSPIKAMEKLVMLGYESIYFVVGSDRFDDFKYKIGEIRQKYKLPVTLVSAGQRINNANSCSPESMSGTKMRLAALNGNTATFKKGTMTNRFTEQNSLNLMKKVRNGLIRGGTRKRLK